MERQSARVYSAANECATECCGVIGNLGVLVVSAFSRNLAATWCDWNMKKCPIVPLYPAQHSRCSWLGNISMREDTPPVVAVADLGNPAHTAVA